MELLEDLEAADERPVIKAEWFAGDRKKGCTNEMEKLFKLARTAGYGVFAADATTRLESCAAALARARAHDGGTGGGGTLYADLYLIPESRKCPPALPKGVSLPTLPVARGDVVPSPPPTRRRDV